MSTPAELIQLQIQELDNEMTLIKQRIQLLYYSALTEEATRITGVKLICSIICETLVSYGKRIREIAFVDETGKECAKLVQYGFDETDEFEVQECYALDMSDEEASDFMMDMKYMVDWSIF